MKLGMMASFCPEINLEKGFSGCEEICSNGGEDSLSQLDFCEEKGSKKILVHTILGKCVWRRRTRFRHRHLAL